MTGLDSQGRILILDGGYANTFMPIPRGWTLDGQGEQDGLLAVRDELDAGAYADHAQRWVKAGTTPEYISQLALRVSGSERGRPEG